MTDQDNGHAVFNRDAVQNTGYLYTTHARLSARIANRRLSDATMDAVSFHRKRVVDIGCGDGTYTIELYDRAGPLSIDGFDPADRAIAVAREKIDGRNIRFSANSAYQLPVGDSSFDIAYLRGVLHHLDRPIDALREALRAAPVVVIIEPNGYNPVLKLLERFSRYHREHGEKSYPPDLLSRWIRSLGGAVAARRWVGLVPFFCPDWLARVLKVCEPLVERLPLMRALGCAVCVQVVTRPTGTFVCP